MVTANQAREKNRLYPVLLLDITLLNSGGTIYLSDRDILVGSNKYQKYVLNMSDISDAVRRDTSVGDNPAVTVRLNNKPFRAYAHLSLIEAAFPLSGGTVEIKERYLDDAGVQSDEAILFSGTFEEITQENIQSFEIIAMSTKVANSLRQIGRG